MCDRFSHTSLVPVLSMSTPNSDRYGLALHTTSPQLGLSISNFAGDARTQTWDLDRDLSTYLHQYSLEFLSPQTWQDITFIAVARGPGSFTSTRIGIVTARTLAQQLEIPLFAFSTFAILAESIFEIASDERTVAIQMPATRGQLYGGIYQRSGDRLGIIASVSDAVMTPESWQHHLERLDEPYRAIETPHGLGETANALLTLAYRDWQLGKRPHWSEVLPFYGS